MRYQEGDTGKLVFGDGTSARVKILKVEPSRSGMFPTDYWLWYEDGETNQQIIHPDFPGKFPLPEGLLDRIFTPDKPGESTESNRREFGIENSFEYRLEQYIQKNFNSSERMEASNLFRKLERTAGREYIEENYLKK